ncbi:hypothetical protein [Nocardioides convexus]|uniref:hypothetical protein n=1 Tax=Nocardioides convexus TaxID=2712224 RepID=UPI0024185FFF|nr:hypothetical protein [Nocardioides convexus]
MALLGTSLPRRVVRRDHTVQQRLRGQGVPAGRRRPVRELRGDLPRGAGRRGDRHGRHGQGCGRDRGDQVRRAGHPRRLDGPGAQPLGDRRAVPRPPGQRLQGPARRRRPPARR